MKKTYTHTACNSGSENIVTNITLFCKKKICYLNINLVINVYVCKEQSIPDNTKFLTILINRLPILFPTFLIRVEDVFAFKKAKNRNLLAGCFDGDERREAKRAQRETPAVKSRNGFFFSQAAPLKLLGDQKTDSTAVERGDKKTRKRRPRRR